MIQKKTYMIYAQEHLEGGKMPSVDILGEWNNKATAIKQLEHFKKSLSRKRYMNVTLQVNDSPLTTDTAAQIIESYEL